MIGLVALAAWCQLWVCACRVWLSTLRGLYGTCEELLLKPCSTQADLRAWQPRSPALSLVQSAIITVWKSLRIMRRTSRKNARSHKHSYYKTQGDSHASLQAVPQFFFFDLTSRALGRMEQVEGGEGAKEEGNIFPSKPRKLRYMWNSFSKISWG